MKKIKILLTFVFIIALATLINSCSDEHDPGLVYMPDMAYSRAYEAYAPNNLAREGVYYVDYPVEGTIRRGDLFPYPLADDSTGYRLSAQIKDPLPPIDSAHMKEAARLFNINCAICHGEKMDAQGPLATGGKVPAVANLTTSTYINMPVGTMYHSITYGKNNMGSYASQLTREQRWMVIQYVKKHQMEISGGSSSANKSDSTTTAVDSTATK